MKQGFYQMLIVQRPRKSVQHRSLLNFLIPPTRKFHQTSAVLRRTKCLTREQCKVKVLFGFGLLFHAMASGGNLVPCFSIGYIKGWKRSLMLLTCIQCVRELKIEDQVSHGIKARALIHDSPFQVFPFIIS